MSTSQDQSKGDLYSELGVEPHSTAAEVMARIEAERERSNLLKKIPKRRSEAESRLARLAEIERVLLNPSARAAYDVRPKGGEQSAQAMLPPEQPTTSAAVVKHDVESAHFCTSCGAALSVGASFCEECATPIPPQDATRPDHETKGPGIPIISDGRIHKSVAEAPETPNKPIPVLTGTKTIKPPAPGPSRFMFLVPIVLIAVLGAIWFFNRKTALPVVVPPVPGQVTDLRPPQPSLLNHPVLQPSPVASWDPQNIHGPVIIKGEKGTQSIVYPNGAQFVLDAKLFPADAAGSAAFKEEYGTVVVESPSTFGGQNAPPTWQVQFQVEQAKDINGDGFPEIVFSNFSGGAHCCTTIAVISLRPQGPVVVFDEPLGSDDRPVFKDLDGDGRREIRFEHLFEYALGSFAQGTFSVPVIYSAGKDGVYRVNTRAFSQIMSNEYDSSSQEHQKKTYDSSEEEDRDLIDMFFRADLAGRSVEAFEALGDLKPLNGTNSTPSDPLAILEDALKKVAPEVLQQPEWVRLKSGQPLAPGQATQSAQQPAAPKPIEPEQPTPAPTPNIADIPNSPPSAVQRQPVPAPVPAPTQQTRGVRHYSGPPIHYGERITFSNLPGARLRFTFDHQLWQPLISRQPDGTQTLTLRSLKQGEQTQCDLDWEIIQ